jgi:hypothetical protein
MRLHGAFALLLTGVLGAGCAAERTLRVTSDPEGSEVWLDGELCGLTPLDVHFTHYGTRRILLLKEGYGTASLRVELQPPWYARFPVDLVSEVLVPVGWKDHHSVHAVLVQGEDRLSMPTLRSVLDRAEALRRAGPEGPGELPPSVRADVATESPR